MEESIWGRKDLIGGKHLGEERFGGLEWRGKHLGEERFNWMESIWGRKDLIGGKHLGEERFNWRKAFGGGKI